MLQTEANADVFLLWRHRKGVCGRLPLPEGEAFHKRSIKPWSLLKSPWSWSPGSWECGFTIGRGTISFNHLIIKGWCSKTLHHLFFMPSRFVRSNPCIGTLRRGSTQIMFVPRLVQKTTRAKLSAYWREKGFWHFGQKPITSDFPTFKRWDFLTFW